MASPTVKSNTKNQKVCKKKNLIKTLVRIKKKSVPRDHWLASLRNALWCQTVILGRIYPHLTPMKDSYNHMTLKSDFYHLTSLHYYTPPPPHHPAPAYKVWWGGYTVFRWSVIPTSFPLNILRMKWWNLTKFCMWVVYKLQVLVQFFFIQLYLALCRHAAYTFLFCNATHLITFCFGRHVAICFLRVKRQYFDNY